MATKLIDLVLSTREKEISYSIPSAEEFSVGSGAENSIQIFCPNISKQHFAIRTNWEKFMFIYDLDSESGTYIGNNRLEKGQLYNLKFGDIISFGEKGYCLQIG